MKLKGYCEKCGLMIGMYERSCVKCGGKRFVKEAPAPAVLFLRTPFVLENRVVFQRGE